MTTQLKAPKSLKEVAVIAATNTAQIRQLGTDQKKVVANQGAEKFIATFDTETEKVKAARLAKEEAAKKLQEAQAAYDAAAAQSDTATQGELTATTNMSVQLRAVNKETDAGIAAIDKKVTRAVRKSYWENANIFCNNVADKADYAYLVAKDRTFAVARGVAAIFRGVSANYKTGRDESTIAVPARFKQEISAKPVDPKNGL